MTAPVIAFFNNKGGVGKTSLVYHAAWMYSDLEVSVLAVDLDPQANLTSAFLDEDRLNEVWPEGDHPETIYGCIQPLSKGIGDIAEPHLEPIAENLALLMGDLALSNFEGELADVWNKCLDGQERAFRVVSAFWRTIQNAASTFGAEVILVDLGPNLGAINRAALIASDYIVVPLSPDLFSLQGLRNLGPTLRKWRGEWQARVEKNPARDLMLPPGTMRPAGYIVLQHSVRYDRPVQAYSRWIARIPFTYRQAVLNESGGGGLLITDDPHCLAQIKHYRSLMPMAQEARKPIFHLTSADGAIGAHFQAARSAFADFRQLTKKIADLTGIALQVNT